MNNIFAFQADEILGYLNAQQQWIGNNATLFRSPITADPISNAVNNLKFSCAGSAGDGLNGGVVFHMYTTHQFTFQPIAGHLRGAHAHFMPQGAVSLVAAGPSGWFDTPGYARFNLSTQMWVEILDGTRKYIFDAQTREESIFWLELKGGSVAASDEIVIEPTLGQFTQDLRIDDFRVIQSDVIRVTASYVIRAMARDGAHFSLDFLTVPTFLSDLGDGLNCPMAVINVVP
jgi:hypothetical protein